MVRKARAVLLGGAGAATALVGVQTIGVPVAGAYNGGGAASWSDQFWNNYQYSSYSDDCVDYVSLSMANGGWPQQLGNLDITNDANWFFTIYQPNLTSYSWRLAGNLKDYVVNHAGGKILGQYDTASGQPIPNNGYGGWQRGDPLFWSFTSRGYAINHVSIKAAWGGEPTAGQSGYNIYDSGGQLFHPIGFGDNGGAAWSLTDQHTTSQLHLDWAQIEDPDNVYWGQEIMYFASLPGNSG